jgi:hypothetical protein
MARQGTDFDWLSVIGKCLSYLCLEQARQQDPDKFDTLPKKVEFLKGMGLSQDDAAYAAGSNPESVRVQLSKQRAKKGVKGGKKSKKK